MIYHFIISIDEDGIFTGNVKELPGCISQGINVKELISNMSEAIKGFLESYKKHNETFLLKYD